MPSGPALDVPADPAPAPVPGVRRLAVLRANGLGDYVVSEPALSALRAAYPDAEITLLGSAPCRPLVEGRPGPVDRFVPVPPVPGVRVAGDEPDANPLTVQRWCDLQCEYGYDLAVQLHGGGRYSNPLLARLGARVTAGPATADALHPDLWVPYTMLQHDTLRWLEVVRAVGAPLLRIEPHLAVTGQDLAASRGALPPGDRPLVVVHPGSSDPRRCWPEQRWGQVARALVARGARVVVLGGPRDGGRVARVQDGAAGGLEQVVGGSLPALIGTLARACLLLGNDSGPRHLAAAVGTPTVGVFTASNLVDVAPLTRTWHRVAVSFASPCAVCGRPYRQEPCGHQASHLADVAVQEVLELAVQLWEQVGAAGRTVRSVAPVRTVATG